MDTARMRAGDYPAVPQAWQVAAGPGDGRYGVQAIRYTYMNAQCRYCGSGCSGPANSVVAHPLALCLACGTPQCDKQRECLVCMAGFVGRPPYSVRAEGSSCGYAKCDGPAVAKAPRVGRVCLAHLSKPVIIRGGNGRITLADTIAAALLQRDRGGQGWQKIAWFGPPKRYYVRRWCPVDAEVIRTGWIGPLDTAGQADREAEAWTSTGWTAERVEATPEITEQVKAWQADADRRLGRTTRR